MPSISSKFTHGNDFQSLLESVNGFYAIASTICGGIAGLFLFILLRLFLRYLAQREIIGVDGQG